MSSLSGEGGGALNGTVHALLRYPVKSLLGEERDAAEVTGRGLARDRVLALVHAETGRVASAKNPRLWRALLTLRAEALDDGVRITLPDGRRVWDSHPGVHTALSEVAGQPVRLTDHPPADARLERAHPGEVLRDGVTATVGVDVNPLASGSFFDFAPLHLLTTATVERIAALHPGGRADVARYRPNIVIDVPGAAGFVENDWLGQTVRIGDDLVLQVIARTPRCAIPTLEHGGLPRDTHALRVLADHNRVVPAEAAGAEPCAGVYAQVVQEGSIRVGDPVEVTAARWGSGPGPRAGGAAG
jgi:hypothetical protein